VATAAASSVSCLPAAAADATRCGRRRFYYGRYRAAPALLLVLLYSQFGENLV